VKQLKADLAKLNADEKEQNEYIPKRRPRDATSAANLTSCSPMRSASSGLVAAWRASSKRWMRIGRALPLCMGVKDAKDQRFAAL
jgi:hypothetical protein